MNQNNTIQLISARENPVSNPSSSTRYVSLNWREISVIAATAVAVCGLAVSLFTGLAWGYTLAFALLSISGFINWKTVRILNQLGSLNNSSESLNYSNTQLQRSEEGLRIALNQIQQKQTLLTQNIEFLNRENSSLNQMNRALQDTNQRLASINQQLGSSETALKTKQRQLETQNKLLGENIEELQQYLQEMKGQNQELTEKMEKMQAAVGQMDHVGDKLSLSSASMERNAQAVDTFISRHSNSLRVNTEYLLKQAKMLETPIRKLDDNLRKMAELQAAIGSDSDNSTDSPTTDSPNTGSP